MPDKDAPAPEQWMQEAAKEIEDLLLGKTPVLKFGIVTWQELIIERIAAHCPQEALPTLREEINDLRKAVTPEMKERISQAVSGEAQQRAELEKEWMAQSEWLDFTNWLIHVKLPSVLEEK